MKLAIIGGTGKLGVRLAGQLSKKLEVQIGSRDRSRAEAAAAGIPGVTGSDELTVAANCDAALLAIPFEAVARMGALAEALAGKLVISPVVPMQESGGLFYYSLDTGSAAEQIAARLGKSRVAAAFHTVPARFFRRGAGDVIDVPVAANDKETYTETASIVSCLEGVRPLYVGPLGVASSIERLTPLLLNLAKLNGTKPLSLKFFT